MKVSYDAKKSTVNCTFVDYQIIESSKHCTVQYGQVSPECTNLSAAVTFSIATSSGRVGIDTSVMENKDKICLSVNASRSTQTVFIEGIFTSTGNSM